MELNERSFRKPDFRGTKLRTMDPMQPIPLDEPDVDLTFTHTYQVQDRFELPGSGESEIPTIYIPPHNRAEHAGLWLRVRASNGRAWTGVFAYGLGGLFGFSRIMSSPDPDSVIVISKGAAYLIRADDPSSYKQLLPVNPVTDARAIAEQGLVLFASFTKLFAYGPDGVRWESSHLCADCLKILGVDGDTITCSGYDPGGSPDTIHFDVDLLTGEERLH